VSSLASALQGATVWALVLRRTKDRYNRTRTCSSQCSDHPLHSGGMLTQDNSSCCTDAVEQSDSGGVTGCTPDRTGRERRYRWCRNVHAGVHCRRDTDMDARRRCCRRCRPVVSASVSLSVWASGAHNGNRYTDSDRKLPTSLTGRQVGFPWDMGSMFGSAVGESDLARIRRTSFPQQTQ
jgi:hypothetical protein